MSRRLFQIDGLCIRMASESLLWIKLDGGGHFADSGSGRECALQPTDAIGLRVDERHCLPVIVRVGVGIAIGLDTATT